MDETRKQTSPKTGSCYFLSVSVQRCMRMPKTTESHSLSSRNPGVTHRGRQAARSPDLRTHPEGNRPHEGQSSIEAITVSFLLRVTQPLLLSYSLLPPLLYIHRSLLGTETLAPKEKSEPNWWHLGLSGLIDSSPVWWQKERPGRPTISATIMRRREIGMGP